MTKRTSSPPAETVTADSAAAEIVPAEAMPDRGGSFVRDPKTGALTRMEWTNHTADEETAAPAGDEPAADTPAQDD